MTKSQGQSKTGYAKTVGKLSATDALTFYALPRSALQLYADFVLALMKSGRKESKPVLSRKVIKRKLALNIWTTVEDWELVIKHVKASGLAQSTYFTKFYDEMVHRLREDEARASHSN